VRFQALTAASMKMTACWDTAPCSLLEVGGVTEVRAASIIRTNRISQNDVTFIVFIFSITDFSLINKY
jgi:hypothetical protein